MSPRPPPSTATPSFTLTPASQGVRRLKPFWNWGWMAVALCLFLTLASRGPLVFVPQLDWDEGTRMSIASALNHGRTLYVDAWDHHTFLDILFFQALFRLLPDATVPVAVRIFGIAAVLAVCLLIYRSVSALAGSAAWAFVSATTAAILFSQSWALSTSGEFLHSLPVCAAFFIYFTGRRSPASLLLTGALLAGGFFIKQTAIFDALAMGLIAFFQQRLTPAPSHPLIPGTNFRPRLRWRQWAQEAVWAFAGAGAITGLSAAYFLYHGSLREALHATLVDPFVYSTGRDLSHSLSKYVEAASSLFYRGLNVNLVVTCGLLATITVLLLPWLEEPDRPRQNRTALGALLWLAVDSAGLVTIGRFYPHYLTQLIPAAAIAASCVVARMRASWQPAVALVFAALVFLAAETPARTSSSRMQDRDAAEALVQTAAFIAATTKPDEGIFIYQNQALCLYFLSGRFPPTKVYMDHQLLPENKDAEALLADSMKRLQQYPPRLVIKGTLMRQVPEIEAFIARHYMPTTNIGSHTLYGLRETAAPSQPPSPSP